MPISVAKAGSVKSPLLAQIGPSTSAKRQQLKIARDGHEIRSVPTTAFDRYFDRVCLPSTKTRCLSSYEQVAKASGKTRCKQWQRQDLQSDVVRSRRLKTAHAECKRTIHDCDASLHLPSIHFQFRILEVAIVGARRRTPPRGHHLIGQCYPFSGRCGGIVSTATLRLAASRCRSEARGCWCRPRRLAFSRSRSMSRPYGS